MLDFLFNDWLVGFGVPILIGVGFALLADEFKEYTAARWCFVVSAVWICGKVITWLVFSTQPLHTRVVIAFLVCGLAGVSLMGAFRLTAKREQSTSRRIEEKPIESVPSAPSFLFVFGAPLGDNNSPIWIMMLQHYGPNPAHNCDVHFYDKDRKNIEHEWLVANPKWPFPPSGIANGESQKSFHFAEAGPTSPVGSFQWSPIDPNRQHYSVSIVCRDGVFAETWEVTRVDGVLRTKITVEHGPDWIKKHPNSSQIIFTCTDPEFIGTTLATKLPSQGPPLVHPGWKPSHKFSVPVAIIDSNHNIQVMSGVATPEGQKTQFGCWNLLTKHLGDKKS
jgi:hypothetical protein